MLCAPRPPICCSRLTWWEPLSLPTKALEFKLHPLLATMMGGITGVGGGTIRDLLIGQVPKVLRSDVYAAAALFGAAIRFFVSS